MPNSREFRECIFQAGHNIQPYFNCAWGTQSVLYQTSSIPLIGSCCFPNGHKSRDESTSYDVRQKKTKKWHASECTSGYCRQEHRVTAGLYCRCNILLVRHILECLRFKIILTLMTSGIRSGKKKGTTRRARVFLSCAGLLYPRT